MLESKLKQGILPFILIYSSLVHADNIGSLLFHGNCITCHTKHRAISAPAISTIKSNYLRAFPKKEDFIASMSTWVEHPNSETSIMLEAIKKHALMPELGFDKSTLEIISAYIYETDFSKENEGYKK